MAKAGSPKIIQPCVNVANGSRTQTAVALLTIQDLYDVPANLVVDPGIGTVPSNVINVAGYRAMWVTAQLVDLPPGGVLRVRVWTVNPETMQAYTFSEIIEPGTLVLEMANTDPTFGFISNDQNSPGPPERSPKTWGYIQFTVENTDADQLVVAYLNVQLDSR